MQCQIHYFKHGVLGSPVCEAVATQAIVFVDHEHEGARNCLMVCDEDALVMLRSFVHPTSEPNRLISYTNIADALARMGVA